MVGSWEMVNKQLWIKDKDWSSILGTGCGGANNFLQLIISMLILWRALNLDGFFGVTKKWNLVMPGVSTG
jgi:hypothetical protein